MTLDIKQAGRLMNEYYKNVSAEQFVADVRRANRESKRRRSTSAVVKPAARCRRSRSTLVARRRRSPSAEQKGSVANLGKYDSVEQRNAALRQLRTEHPEWSNERIAAEMGISERLQRLLVKQLKLPRRKGGIYRGG